MSEEENKNAGTWRFLNVLFVLCVIGLIVMVIVSTILSQKRMKAKKIEAIQKRKQMKEREDDPSGGASTQGSAQAGAGGVNPRKKALSVSSDGDKPG